MSTKPVVHFYPHEKTRLLGTPDGDKHLCPEHANKRLDAGQALGVPASAGAMMFGAASRPTGQEPCDDCEQEKQP